MVDSRTIRLRIISYHRLSRTQEAERHFDIQGSKTLGRNVDCDWVLPDPSRVVSGIHASIFYRDDGFVVRDESTNGLFINNASDPLGKDKTAELNVGDVLFLGEYEVEVVAIGNTRNSGKAADTDQPNIAIPNATATSGANALNTRPDNLGLSSDAFSIPAVTPITPKGGPQTEGQTSQQPFIPEQFDNHLSAFARPQEPSPEKIEAPAAPTLSQEIRPEPNTKTPIDGLVTVSESKSITGFRTDQPLPAVPAPEGNEAFFRSYTEALGIADERGLTNLAPAELGRKAGQLTRELLEGLLQLMRMRETTKSEFRAAQTRIRVGDNNPLKFSATADDAVFNLLLQRRSSYLEPVEAVRKSFEDIASHQAGLLNGMQSVFTALMAHFDPEQIGQKERPESLMARLSASGRKAEAWDRYQALYSLLADQHGDSLLHHFSDEFVTAYEQTGTQEAHRE